MQNLIGYLTNLGTQAALVAGFGLGFFVELPNKDTAAIAFQNYTYNATTNITTDAVESVAAMLIATTNTYGLRLIFYMCVAICLGTQMYVVCNSTMCTVLGPTMGLVGPRGSMHVAVKGLYAERTTTWGMFAAGLFTFNAAVIVHLWIILKDKMIAGACSFLLVMITGVTLSSCARILRTFEFKNETEHLSGVEYMKQKALQNKDAQHNPLAVKEGGSAVV